MISTLTINNNILFYSNHNIVFDTSIWSYLFKVEHKYILRFSHIITRFILKEIS